MIDMSRMQDVHRQQKREARLVIVSEMLKKGYTVRQTRDEVMKRLGIEKLSVSTIQNDREFLLKEWRKVSISNVDDALQLELERIDHTCRELWSQWERSKEDYNKTTNRRKGKPSGGGSDGKISTVSIEEMSTKVIGLGNPAYISEIRQQLQERRKLLGLYAPEKREVSGEMSFIDILKQTSIDDLNG